MRNVEALFNEFRNSNSHPALTENSSTRFHSRAPLIRRTKDHRVNLTNERIVYIIRTRANKISRPF